NRFGSRGRSGRPRPRRREWIRGAARRPCGARGQTGAATGRRLAPTAFRSMLEPPHREVHAGERRSPICRGDSARIVAVTRPTSTLFDKPRLSPSMTIAGNGLITLGATGLAMLASNLFQAVVARNLNTTAYGELAAVVATLNVVSIPLFGVCMALTRDVAATYALYGSELLPLIRPYLTRVGGLTLASVVRLFAALPLLTVFFQFASPTPVLFLALLIVLTNAVGVARSALLGLHQFLSVGINQVLEATLRLLAAGVIMWYWPVESAGLAGY